MSTPLLAGRYRLFEPIASGGMATVHYGRLLGEAGFARTVAIKRVHPKHGQSGTLVAALIDEARIASRIQHPNVVPTLDVFADAGELFVVMEFVMGETLARLSAAAMASASTGGGPGELVPVPIVANLGVGMLQGLHAAHEAKNERGQRLGIVHRDISPQNVLVGVDGLVRVLDFGIAKAEDRMTSTLSGQIKGKPKYMAPEQIRGEAVSPRTDVFATGIVLWELLAGRRMFRTDMEVVSAFAEQRPPDPASRTNPAVPAKLDAVLRRAMAFEPIDRFEDAASFAVALEEAVDVASQRRVSEWLRRVAGPALDDRARKVLEVESEAAPRGASSAEDDVTRTDAFGARGDAASDTFPSTSDPHNDVTIVAPAPDDRTVDVAPAVVLASARRVGATSALLPVVPEQASPTEPKTPSLVEPPRRSRTVLLGALGALLVGATTATLVLLDSTTRSTDPTPTVALGSSAQPDGPPTSAASAAPPLAASATAERSASPPVVEPASGVTASPTSSPAQPRSPSPPARSNARATAPPAPAPDCTVPYVLDKSGVRRFKPECL